MAAGPAVAVALDPVFELGIGNQDRGHVEDADIGIVQVIGEPVRLGQQVGVQSCHVVLRGQSVRAISNGNRCNFATSYIGRAGHRQPVARTLTM